MEEKIIKYLLIINLGFISLILFTKVTILYKLIRILIKSVIAPLMISLFFYYLIRPLNEVFKKKGLKSSVASVLTLTIWIFILSGIFFYFSQSIIPELNGLINQFKNIGEKNSDINKRLDQIGKYIDMNNIYKIFMESMNKYIENIIPNLHKGFKYVMDSFSKFLLIMITIFYLLKDGEKFKNGFINLLPYKYKSIASNILEESHVVLSQYVIGQSKVAISLATMIYIGYRIIHIPNALLFSALTFILAFIPYIGFFISMIIPTIIAISIGFKMIIKLAITFIVVQTLKGRVVVPAIMGYTMKIHPLTDIFLVIGAVAFGGPLAAFVIVPIYAILKILINNIYDYVIKERLSK
ncbi:AI-2E family transporter [uncultured Clostridium sp.]|uniref:AI-2E family transporter n=1 Tax=uncultured Clostridium sp. TaxID=59620 RepID=UPI0028EC89ED|nr:AI-2E family transporter [uncultured Clostridium sp.]